LLWTFSDGSFVPHEIAGGHDADCPIVISHDHEPIEASQVLVNLAPEVPPFFSRFERVAEIVSGSAETRAQGRERYKFYRDRGYELRHHEIATG
jgi:DNA polymerase-3 subunit chi